ncbi:hypothetical protein LKD37_02540 [Oscillospiraceae bacterium CLA-AA-H272]|uniref:Lipoprotein n=3 Tax=Brotocaccenecus cirricatena TaxID=3064195 RepID=A0AAE3DE73_9FIRM|nr:hypothetical protein [Brotocaccenecus cirricatena]MCC2128406.1 hypothetical protein [Brotocaccenecus cirricatena]
MKRRLLLPLMLLALALSLTACAAKPAAPTAADFEVQPGEYRYQDRDGFFVETEKGNYYMNPSGDGLIHFAEPGSHEFHVLCNKPNCGHASADCNAFLEVAFGYYNGHLYGVTLQDQFELIQMDMDGTNHRVITQLPKQYDLSGGSSGGGSYFFDNGYLIYLAMPISSGDPDYAMAVYKIQLETGEITRLFQEDIPVHTDWPSAGVSISNGYLYFPMFNGETGSVTHAEGNLETGRIEHIFEDWNQSNSPMVNFDNVLHYHRVGVGLCEYDKATGTETVKVPTDCSLALPQYTKDYIIVRTSDDDADTHRTIYAYDRNYHLLGQMELEPYGVKFPSLQYVTANAIYFTSGGKLISYIDPHHLDRLELIQLMDPTARSHG